MNGVRCVVTGVNADGKAVFVRDAPVEPYVSQLGGAAFHQFWGSDDVVPLPSDGAEPAWSGYFPPSNGVRFNFFTMMPESRAIPADLDVGAAYEELQQRLPGLSDVMEPDGPPGMHTTDTIDFEVVLSGQVICELDDGAEVTLNPGDTFVQNGTRHRWRNPGAEPAVLAVFIAGAHRRDGSA